MYSKKKERISKTVVKHHYQKLGHEVYIYTCIPINMLTLNDKHSITPANENQTLNSAHVCKYKLHSIFHTTQKLLKENYNIAM